MLTRLANQCTTYPNRDNKKQKTLFFQPKKSGEEGGKLVASIFSVEACREALCRMVIVNELPFRFVEGKDFRFYSITLELRFEVPSRITVARDCLKLYVGEKQNLRDILHKISQRVCLTTDTWTSVQNLNYMCLTAHYIDCDWNLQ